MPDALSTGKRDVRAQKSSFLFLSQSLYSLSFFAVHSAFGPSLFQLLVDKAEEIFAGKLLAYAWRACCPAARMSSAWHVSCVRQMNIQMQGL